MQYTHDLLLQLFHPSLSLGKTINYGIENQRYSFYHKCLIFVVFQLQISVLDMRKIEKCRYICFVFLFYEKNLC